MRGLYCYTTTVLYLVITHYLVYHCTCWISLKYISYNYLSTNNSHTYHQVQLQQHLQRNNTYNATTSTTQQHLTLNTIISPTTIIATVDIRCLQVFFPLCQACRYWSQSSHHPYQLLSPFRRQGCLTLFSD